jgi:hypothetical protein
MTSDLVKTHCVYLISLTAMGGHEDNNKIGYSRDPPKMFVRFPFFGAEWFRSECQLPKREISADSALYVKAYHRRILMRGAFLERRPGNKEFSADCVLMFTPVSQVNFVYIRRSGYFPPS